MKKIIAILLTLCMISVMLPVTFVEEYEATEKVRTELLEILGVTYEELKTGTFVDDGKEYSCIIWLHDVNVEEAVEEGIDAAERTRDICLESYDYPYTIYKSDGLTYVDVDLNETEDDEYVQTYIETERAAAVKLYEANNSNFVAENFMARDMSVTYVSQYSPCVFANLNISKISELIENDDVVRIGYAKEDRAYEKTDSSSSDATISVTEIQEAMNVIAANQARMVYNVTGAGVKIGQIELACPNTSSVIVNPNGCNTKDKININSNIVMLETTHPDNVHLIMSTVAPGATYYATGAYNSNDANAGGIDYYQRVEWLLSQGVNIINYSGGFYDNLNEYDDRANWTDHIAYNHDVHFVKSAGNYSEASNPGKDVSSPGMAYNIITVGAISRESPYELEDYSAYNDDGVSRYLYNTYKPDLVAPGSFTATSGTSFATPLVTGTIALMCEYEPTLKVKQHTVKAILAASTGKETGRYITYSEEFEQYGAGVVDAKAALWVISQNNYSYYTGTISESSPTKSYEMTVTASDTRMRIALAYAYRIKYDASVGVHNGDNTPIGMGMIGEVSVSVYSPDGVKIIGYNGYTGANLKVCEFDPRPYGVGTYTIVVTLEIPQEGGSATNFGIAWR